MGQKRSDLDTIPMCQTHHDFQHQVGWPLFIRKYEIDIAELLKAFKEKPRFVIRPVPIEWPFGIRNEQHYFAEYRGELIRLHPACNGLSESIGVAKDRCREHLIDTLFRPLVEKRHIEVAHG